MGVIISLPLCIIIAIFIRLDSQGPILFTQQRTARRGKSFKIYKFRTMTVNNDMRDLAHTNQMTRVGKYIRLFSLDEIPQLINILKGDMSFIGPRAWPHDYYLIMTDKQRQRYSVRPGVSGLAQVSGRYSLSIEEKIKLDIAYIKNINWKDDIKIIVRTFKAILNKSSGQITKQGIYEELQLLKESPEFVED